MKELTKTIVSEIWLKSVYLPKESFRPEVLKIIQEIGSGVNSTYNEIKGVIILKLCNPIQSDAD